MPVSHGHFERTAAAAELQNIANWWLKHSLDTRNGGFVGEIGHDGAPLADANKGIILNARILWFFSEHCLFDEDNRSLAAAHRAYRYLVDYFDDKEHGGVVWELAANGAVINSKKQVYALAFCIYALTAYYRLTSNPDALKKSLEYFDAVESHACDHQDNGYFEAYSRQWQTLDDVRLGEDDMNAPKTMNTHLHLLEAYTALHNVAPTERTEAALRNLIGLFCSCIVDRQSRHLKLFFDQGWNSLSAVVSFGHDIEASWLLSEAAAALADPGLADQVRPVVTDLAEACLREGVGEAGQVCHEYDPQTSHLSTVGVWWVQAEGLVGFLNAFILTGEKRYLDSCQRLWKYICEHQLDTRAGEWHWLSGAPEAESKPRYKAGFWKAPYHNGRAMMQACKLFDHLEIVKGSSFGQRSNRNDTFS